MIRALAAGLGRAALMIAIGATLGACNQQTEGEIAGAEPIELSRAAALVATCSGCHSAGGEALVSLDRLSADDLTASLTVYRDNATGTTTMHRIARGYSDTDIAEISAYLARGAE